MLSAGQYWHTHTHIHTGQGCICVDQKFSCFIVFAKLKSGDRRPKLARVKRCCLSCRQNPQPSSLFVVFPAEAQAEEPAAETDHGPTAKPHLGDQLHAGHQELRQHRTETGQEGWVGVAVTHQQRKWERG